jgi:hypothetical protein
MGGEIMGRPGELGVVKPGALADLLLVEGDPLTDIAILQDRSALRMIMKDGALHKGPSGASTSTLPSIRSGCKTRGSPCCRRRPNTGHARAWPANPNAASRIVDVNFIVPDMIAKAIAGMPTNRALAWAEDQVKLAVQGKLEGKGKSWQVTNAASRAPACRDLPGGRPGRPAVSPRAQQREATRGASANASRQGTGTKTSWYLYRAAIVVRASMRCKATT